MELSIELVVEELLLEAGFHHKSLTDMFNTYKKEHRLKTKPFSAEKSLVCLGCDRYIRTPKFISYKRTNADDTQFVGIHEHCLERAVAYAKEYGVKVEWKKTPQVTLVIDGFIPHEAARNMREPDSAVWFIRNEQKEIVGFEWDVPRKHAQEIANQIYRKVLERINFSGSAYMQEGDKRKILWRTE